MSASSTTEAHVASGSASLHTCACAVDEVTLLLTAPEMLASGPGRGHLPLAQEEEWEIGHPLPEELVSQGAVGAPSSAVADGATRDSNSDSVALYWSWRWNSVILC